MRFNGRLTIVTNVDAFGFQLLQIEEAIFVGVIEDSIFINLN